MSAVKSAKLSVDGKEVAFEIRQGTIGPDVIDIAQALRPDRACSPTIPASPRRRAASRRSPISTATRASCSIAAIPIEQLAEHGDFLESLLPAALRRAADGKAQKADFDYRVTRHTMVHEQMARFFQGFRRDAHPMAVMVRRRRRAGGLLSRLDRHHRSAAAHDRLDAHDRQDADASRPWPTSTRRPALRVSANDARLHLELPAHVLCRALPRSTSRQSGAVARAWTASSSSMPTMSRTPRPRRCASPAPRAPTPSPASRPASPASVGPGPWRRQRSGAEHARPRSARVDRIPEFIAKAKDKNDPFRLMGFGHRVYKNYDPRAKIMQKTCA
jgi:citrate synthase